MTARAHGKEPAVSDLYSTGGAAKELGCSPSLLRKLELLGITPPAHRLSGSDRRAYSAEQLEELREVLNKRQAANDSHHLAEAA